MADVTAAGQAPRMFDAAAGFFGRAGVLVNNAGGGKPPRFMEITESDRDAMLAFNWKSVFLRCQAALRLMLPRKAGKNINIASVAGRSRTLGPAPIMRLPRPA